MNPPPSPSPMNPPPSSLYPMDAPGSAIYPRDAPGSLSESDWDLRPRTAAPPSSPSPMDASSSTAPMDPVPLPSEWDLPCRISPPAEKKVSQRPLPPLPSEWVLPRRMSPPREKKVRQRPVQPPSSTSPIYPALLPSEWDPPRPLRRMSPPAEKKVSQRSEDLSNASPRDAVSTVSPSAAAGRRELRSLLLHSVVFAVIIPALFFYSGGQSVLAGWSVSLFVLLYLFCCSISYSTAATALTKIFFALFCLALIASSVGFLLSSAFGMVLIYMDSILAAGIFGSVLAQHRESKFTEMAAFVAVSGSPLGKYSRQTGIYVILAIMAMFYALCWVFIPIPHYRPIDIMMNLFGAVASLLSLHIYCVLGWLKGACFGDDCLPIINSCAIIAMLFVASYLLAGELVAASVLFLSVHVSSAFLGYYLRVHATYETMMIMREDMLALITAKTHKED